MLQNANVSTSTSAKTIDVVAARNVTMADGTSVTTTDGDARIEATAGTITSETVTLGTGNLNLIAGLDIADLDGSSLITANGLMMTAGSGIGSSANVLNTAVGTLAASAAADGIFVTETSGLTIGDVITTVQRVDSTGLDSNLSATQGNQEDLTTTSDGAHRYHSDRRQLDRELWQRCQ